MGNRWACVNAISSGLGMCTQTRAPREGGGDLVRMMELSQNERGDQVKASRIGEEAAIAASHDHAHEGRTRANERTQSQRAQHRNERWGSRGRINISTTPWARSVEC